MLWAVNFAVYGANRKNAMKNFLLVCLLVCSMFLLGMTGNTSETVVVPNVEGISLELAAHVLRNAGLQPQGMSAAFSSRVSRQEPRSGFEVPVGSVVILLLEGQQRILNAGQASSTVTSQNSRTVIQSTRPPTTSQPVSVLQMWGTRVTVTPQDGTAANLQGQSQIQSGARQNSRQKLLYEPVQPRLSPYFVQNTTQRFYPAWYPKQFIPSSASSTPTVSTQFTTGVQSVSSPYTITVRPATPQHFTYTVSGGESGILSYPTPDSWSKGASSIQTQRPTRTGLIQTSTSPAVSVPNVARLHQQDAAAALMKASLLTGMPTFVDSAQVRSGHVVRQAPQARQLVPAGTQIQLWIAR